MIILKLVCIKAKKDDKSFKIFKTLGAKVYELEDLEKTDLQIRQCVKDDYDTILISEELANFSGDIITKYKKNKAINIIITNRRI